MGGEFDLQPPFGEKVLHDVEASIRAAFDYQKDERDEMERGDGFAHERVRSISSVMDGLEQAVLLLNALPGSHPIHSYPPSS